MKQIKIFIVTMIALVLSSCEAEKWSQDTLENVAVYELQLTTLIDLSETSSLQIQYIDIYQTLDFVLESTNLSTYSGVFYRYDIVDYCDYSSETEYNINFDLIFDETTTKSYSISGSKSTGVVNLTIKNGDEELYNQDDVILTETEKAY